MLSASVQRLKQNRLFAFLSSVRLAVPLMIVIAIVVAIGTIYESRYNAQVASILVYRTLWFRALMGLLWLNIFCSTVSRYPFKIHHLGFVITHIGLLMLLIGAQVTASWGIDGQLRVLEGQSSSTVFLSDLILKISNAGGQSGSSAEVYRIDRSLSPRAGGELGVSKARETSGVLVDDYLPFVSIEKTLVKPANAAAGSSGIAASFSLQSPFFKVNDTLDTASKPSMEMGPALLKLIVEQGDLTSTSVEAPKTEQKRRAIASSGGSEAKSGKTLVAKDAKTGAVLDRFPVSSLRGKTKVVQGVKLSVAQVYEQAVVSGGKITEAGQPGANPALELKLESAGKTMREVVYAKFPNFSLNANGSFGLRFEYSGASSAESASAEAQDIPMHSAGTPPPAGSRSNVIEFHVSPNDLQHVKVVLLKQGAQVMSRVYSVGEVIQTPWMGMKITVTSVAPGGVVTDEIRPTEMQPRRPLPPSAIRIRSDLPGDEGVWLLEGEARTVQTSKGAFEVYYGMDSVELPFTVKLDEFRKVDYPGTETAMSFESTIRLNGGGVPTRIQMNEPFNREGYLLYQSSYEQGPGIPTASIFSVNRDPGRLTKYLGAVILVLGIVIFTLMRSKLYLNWKRGAV